MQRILVVDDRPENIMAIEAILERPGLELIKASSGNEALRLLLKHDVALALLDVQMPGMDGFEMAELMRRNKKTQNIPIIFVTALTTDTRYVFKGYQSGAVDYLFKPLEPVVLESKVSVFLELDRQRMELAAQLEEIRALKEVNDRLLGAVGEAIVAVDAGGRITYANPAFSSLLSNELGVFEGRPLMELMYPGTDGVKGNWITSEIFLGCRHGHSVELQSGSYLRNGGDFLPVEVKASPVNAPESAFGGAVLVLRVKSGPRAEDLEMMARQNRKQHRKQVAAVLRTFDRSTGFNIGRIANISTEGFKVVTREAHNVGTEMQLSMVLPETICGSNTMSFDARVIWCSPSEYTSDYRCGFRITQMGESDARILEHLLSRL